MVNNGASIDTITNTGNGLSGGGMVAQRLLQNNFNVNALRTNTTLRYREWIAFDKQVLEIARMRLIGVQDLISRGLTWNLPNALGHTRVEWETMTDLTPAELTMSGISRSEMDRPEFNLVGMPVPIIHKDFNINIRALQASRNGDRPLDTTQAALASRVVSEKIEELLFLGSTALGANNAIYGYTTAPFRSTGSLTANWATATGANIVTDVLAMQQKAYDDHMYGPFVFYVPLNAFTHMGDDHKAESDRTILERVKAIPNVSDVRPSENLASGNVVMVQMTPDVVQMIDGIQPTIVEWESHGGMVLNFKVMAIMLPRIRNDAAEQSGIVHYFKA